MRHRRMLTDGAPNWDDWSGDDLVFLTDRALVPTDARALEELGDRCFRDPRRLLVHLHLGSGGSITIARRDAFSDREQWNGWLEDRDDAQLCTETRESEGFWRHWVDPREWGFEVSDAGLSSAGRIKRATMTVRRALGSVRRRAQRRRWRQLVQ